MSPTRLRILALTPRVFYPANTGGRIRSLKIFEQLSKWHDVTLVCLRSPEDGVEHLERMRACCTRLELVEWRETPKFSLAFYAGLASNLLGSLPYTVVKYRSPAVTERLAALLASGDHDVFVCDFLQPSINCLTLPFRPKVLFQHNVETTVRQRLAAHASNPMARAYLLLDAKRLMRYERRAAHLFDHCIMVSADDCRLMSRAHGMTRTSAIPPAVDVDYFRPMPEDDGEAKIVFLGSLDMLANQDAVLFFAREILPLVRRHVAVTFVVAGRNPPPSITRLAESRGITVTGTVEDVRPYLGAAQVLVVPLRIGGGTRLKIFEAMAMAKAVVSTSVGAEGLPVTDGADIVLADTPERFAEAVVTLLRDAGERKRLGEAAHRLVSAGYSWGAAAARFSEICMQVVNRLQSARSSPTAV